MHRFAITVLDTCLTDVMLVLIEKHTLPSACVPEKIIYYICFPLSPMLSSTAIGVYEFIIRVLSEQIKFRATGRPCSNHRAQNESMTRRHIQYGGVQGEVHRAICSAFQIENLTNHQKNAIDGIVFGRMHLHVYTCRLERVAGSQLVIRPSAQPYVKERDHYACCLLS